MTLRSIGDHDLVHTYLWPQFDEDWGSLRLSNAYFNVWPWTLNIWPWRQKFKIPPHEISAYGPKEHFYAFSALSYQNCGTSSKKYEKMHKNDQFFTRTGLTAFRTTSRPMPGRYFFEDAYTWAISWWSDFGKVVKKVEQTDGRTDRRSDGHSHFYICEPLAADKNVWKCYKWPLRSDHFSKIRKFLSILIITYPNLLKSKLINLPKHSVYCFAPLDHYKKTSENATNGRSKVIIFQKFKSFCQYESLPIPIFWNQNW